jgi:SNF2 family DNA or RNA helicase
MSTKLVNLVIDKSVKFKKLPESLFVSFDYSIEALENVKKLPEEVRKYIPATRQWEVNLAYFNQVIENYAGYEINLIGNVETQLPEPPEVKERATFIDTELGDFNFKTKPFDHQVDGLMFGKKHPKFILGDEQGLGKTKQAIDLAVSRKGQFKHCLIVCGVNSVKFNWLKEIQIHSNETGHILGSYINTKGQLKDDGPLEYRLDDLESDLDDFFLITNIETFRQGPKTKKPESMSKQEQIQAKILDRVEELTRSGQIGMVIIDEIHKAKNPTSKQGKAIHRLMPHYKMALTGTPLMNSPLDLYNLLKWLEVENHSFQQFRNYYCTMGGYGGYEVQGYKNLEHLKNKLQGVMLRRLKKDALNLPPKIRQTEYVELEGSQAKLYKEIRDEIIDKIEELELSPNPLAVLTRLRQVTSYPQILSEKIAESAKMERMEEMIEELVENDQKAIVFSNWSQVTTAAKKRLAKYNPAYIDGSTKDRMAEVEKFQNDPSCKVIIGTIGAMGTGLTLTAAQTVFFLDKPWNAALMEQCEDRAHRIGTTGTVNIVSLVVEGSVDERIEELILEKADMSEALVDGKLNKLEKVQLIQRLLS